MPCLAVIRSPTPLPPFPTTNNQQYVCHAHLRNDGLGGTCITDESYPIRVAYALLAEAMEAFSASYEAWADISVNGDNKVGRIPLFGGLELVLLLLGFPLWGVGGLYRLLLQTVA